LLIQFLTPLINRRSDGYGGRLLAHRARFPAEVIAALRAALPDSMPILVKMNADDGLPWGGLKLDDAVAAAQIFARAGADAVVPSFGYTSLNGFGMLRGDVPLEQMAEAMPYRATRWLVRWLGRVLVPAIPFQSMFLRDAAVRFVEALRGSAAVCIYVGGCDSLGGVQEAMAMGCAAVQIGRPLIREPWFVRKLEAAHRALQHEPSGAPTAAKSAPASASASASSESTCVRCNLCTLASIDPVRFPSGCPYLQPGEGQAFEPADIEDL
jgi:2,4-dienoyl-CoA reductase-like NADH-dependent reductase (Old Yellow Enzyme family)